MTAHLVYALAWLAFAATHSGLAGGRLKAWAGRWHRIAYNLVALAQFAAVAGVGAAVLGGEPAFDLPGWLKAAMAAVHLSGWVLMVVAGRWYDLGRLAGTAQLKGAGDDEPLGTGGIHAWVRHPFYAAGFLILWGAALSPLGLATAAWGSLYLLAGTWFEERRLLGLYGAAYADYRARVPAFIPWRGRVS
ncbi:MAG: methyltransferase family protein [Actinomycetota bacterium]